MRTVIILAGLLMTGCVSVNEPWLPVQDTQQPAIGLDGSEPEYRREYLEHLQQKIKSNWIYPCLRNHTTGLCEYKTTSLVVELGIVRDGSLEFVKVLQSSGVDVYDEIALNAIRLAAPFHPVPAAMMTSQESVGVAIRAKFNYVVDDRPRRVR